MIRLGALALLALPLAAVAEERIVDIRQGTNLSVAFAPRGEALVVDLLGQLWRLPVSGGGAVPLTRAGTEARNPRVSPDGGRVVYQRRSDDHWDLWLLDIATGVERPLTTTAHDEREPDFTADGRSVVFVANRAGHFTLWSLALDGGTATELTDGSGDAAFPVVSEDGHVAYVQSQGSEWSVRVRDPSGAITVVHTSTQRLFAPTWRPGGGVLVFGEQESVRASRLQMLLLAEPRVLKPLSDSEDVFASRAAWVSSAEFIYAADGQLWRREVATPVRRPIHLFAASAVEVATPPADLPPLDAPGEHAARGVNGVVHSPDGRDTAFTALGDLWLAARGPPQRLTDDAFVDLDPAFWPDGESVAFSSERTGQFELWRISLRDDRRLTQLTFGALQPRYPAVSIDGKRIAYLERTSLEPWAPMVLKVRDASNGTETIVARDLISPAAPAWSEDGRALRVRALSATIVNGAPREFTAELQTIGNGDGAEPPRVAWQSPAPPADYVVQIGRLFDGVQGTYRRHVDLHVRGGRIAAVVGRGVLPARGEIVDARDATVIPGLIDLHAHQSALMGERLGRAWLAYGVTTVREIAPNPVEALERAEIWASGRAPGPRLLITPAMDVGAAPADAEAPIRPYRGIAAGFAHSLPRQTAAIGIPDFGRSGYPARLTGAAARPTTELELSPGLSAYQDGISRLIASDVTFVSGLAALAGLADRPTSARVSRDAVYRALFTPAEQAAWERPDVLGTAVPTLVETIARLVRAGGRVAIGSDAPAVPPGLGTHVELVLLAETGLANDQILRMATIQGALALGLERDLGTLEEGKLADFVVLYGDPLAQIADTQRIVAVAKGGVWHDRAALLGTP